MHPGVVVALVPPADHDQLAGAGGRLGRPVGSGPASTQLRSAVDDLLPGAQPLVMCRPSCNGPRSTPDGFLRSSLIVTPLLPVRSSIPTRNVGLTDSPRPGAQTLAQARAFGEPGLRF